jgi:hypothetical protein
MNATDRYMAKMEADSIQRAVERAERYSKNPARYEQRRQILGWGRDVPRGVTPAEPEPSQLPGYRLHLATEAIVDAFLELRAERQRSRRNTDERDDIKAAYGPVFADVGIRLVKIPNWLRSERTIMEPRLR